MINHWTNNILVYDQIRKDQFSDEWLRQELIGTHLRGLLIFTYIWGIIYGFRLKFNYFEKVSTAFRGIKLLNFASNLLEILGS